MSTFKINKIERSKRRTIALIINADATLTIRAPYIMPKFFIDRFVAKKQDWINKKINQVKLKPPAIKHTYQDGESFLYLDKSYQLKIGKYLSVSLKKHLLFPETKTDDVRNTLIDWYKKQAFELISQRVILYSNKINTDYSTIKLSRAKKHWGFCTGKNAISINWRLIMAPLEILDYVIVHELAHIKQKNHSKKFWASVEVIYPNYKQAKKWLKENGNTLYV